MTLYAGEPTGEKQFNTPSPGSIQVGAVPGVVWVMVGTAVDGEGMKIGLRAESARTIAAQLICAADYADQRSGEEQVQS